MEKMSFLAHFNLGQETFSCLFRFLTYTITQEAKKMDKEQQKALYQEAIELLLRQGTRFTVDDLSSSMHMSKKTIYAFASSKTELAKWIYQEAYEDFDDCLKNALENPALSQAPFLSLLLSYGTLLVINQETTFNRYSLDSSIKSSSLSKLGKTKKAFASFLLSTPMEKLMANKSFLISLEASLIALRENENCKKLIPEYRDCLLEAL